METIVTFAAINCPPGKFNASRILANVPQNVVFLNCPKNGWFLQGIPGLGNNIEETATGLKAMFNELGIANTRMLYWGGSMGGFGAVVFGALANAELVVATGAELALLIEGGNSELILKKLQKHTHFPIIPIQSWIERSKTRFHLYIGEFAYCDLVSALQIADYSCVEIITLRDFGHSLPGYLNETYGLYTFLYTQFTSSEPVSLEHGESGILNEYRDWWCDLHAVSMNLPSCKTGRLVAGLQGRANIPAEVAGHCGYALSLGATLQGDHEAALKFAREALHIGGPSRYLSFRLVQAMRAIGVPSKVWLENANKIENLSNTNRLDFGDQLIELIAQGYYNANDKKLFVKFISNQRKLSKDQPTRIALLDRLERYQWSSTFLILRFTLQCSELFYHHVLDHKKVTANNQSILVSGVMLADSPQNQIVKISMQRKNGTVTTFSMNIESPGLAKLHPNLPHAACARFKINLQFTVQAQDKVFLYGETAGGKVIEWLVIERLDGNT